MKFDMALIEKASDDDALSQAEIKTLLTLFDPENTLIPIEIEAEQHECSAMGFISEEAFDNIDYDPAVLKHKVSAILDDMTNETADGCYTLSVDGETISMYLSRDVSVITNNETAWTKEDLSTIIDKAIDDNKNNFDPAPGTFCPSEYDTGYTEGYNDALVDLLNKLNIENDHELYND